MPKRLNIAAWLSVLEVVLIFPIAALSFLLGSAQEVIQRRARMSPLFHGLDKLGSPRLVEAVVERFTQISVVFVILSLITDIEQVSSPFFEIALPLGGYSSRNAFFGAKFPTFHPILRIEVHKEENRVVGEKKFKVGGGNT